VAAAKLPFSIPDPYVWWIGPAFRAALAVIRTVKPDVILSTSPPHSVHLVGLALKAWTSLPWVIDLRDPWARNPWQASHDWKLRQSLHRVFERLCVRRADLVILNTPELAEDFERTYARAWRTRFSVLPNGYDPDLLPHVQRLIAQAPRDPHVLRIGHVGAVYGRRDLAPLVLAMEKLLAAGRRVRLDLVGPIDQSQEIEALVRARGLAEHVKLWGRVRYDEALLHTAQSDVLLVIRNNTPLQAPAKLYEILMFRRPIVALDDGGGAAARLVRQFSLGAVADPTDAASIAAAVEAAVAAAGNGRAAQGRENALAEFDGRKQVARLATLLDQAARNSPSRR
jgi:glycosyltransferase involved in cell wall biosynthesis